MIYKENFHTHLDYCRHAIGRATDYIEAAQKAGFYALGFSDHTPFPPDSHHTSRMKLSEIETYRNEVLEAKANSSLKIYMGLEVDIENSLESFYQTLLTQYPFDYHIGSIHTYMAGGQFIYTPDITNYLEASTYMNLLIEAAKNPRYSFIGHPDRFYYSEYVGFHLHEFEFLWRQFCQTCLQHQMPIELNTSNNYELFYEEGSPLLRYWEIVAEYGLKVIINSDAHNPAFIDRHFTDAYALAKKLGLKVISFSRFLNEKNA